MPIAKVTLTSAVGTTRRYSTPADLAAQGSQSTGIRSMVFISRIQTKSVSASGAMTRLCGGWLKVSPTLRSTNPTVISTSVWILVGMPAEAFFATRLKIAMRTMPRTTETTIESTFTAQKLPWHSFQTHSPSCLQTVRC